MMWIMYGMPMPMASAEIVAVTGPNGIPSPAMIPNDRRTTRTTGAVVITPSIGRPASMAKLTTSRINAAMSVMISEENWESRSVVTMTSLMISAEVPTALRPALVTGSKASITSSRSWEAPDSPACVVRSNSAAS